MIGDDVGLERLRVGGSGVVEGRIRRKLRAKEVDFVSRRVSYRVIGKN